MPVAAAPGAAKPAGREPTPARTLRRQRRDCLRFENLLRSLGQECGDAPRGYADPRTGQPMLDLEGARERSTCWMPCAKRRWEIWRPRKTTLVVDILGNLKLAVMEMTKASENGFANMPPSVHPEK